MQSTSDNLNLLETPLCHSFCSVHASYVAMCLVLRLHIFPQSFGYVVVPLTAKDTLGDHVKVVRPYR